METETKERALLLGVDLHDGEDFERSRSEEHTSELQSQR